MKLKRNTNISAMVKTALLFAVSLILSLVESAIPPIAMLPPGVKLGISNIAVMEALHFVGVGSGLSIAGLKGIFVISTRGVTGGFLSLTGGLLSVLAMWLARKSSPISMSVAGALAHNAGQLLAVSLIYGVWHFFLMTPVLIISGIVVGVFNGILINILRKRGL